MDMRKLVGRNFSRLRREKGLTQEQVEERSGFSQQYLSSLERGRRNPTVIVRACAGAGSGARRVGQA
jgi:transcriptional regulator with XRE-family HTH domain